MRSNPSPEQPSPTQQRHRWRGPDHDTLHSFQLQPHAPSLTCEHWRTPKSPFRLRRQPSSGLQDDKSSHSRYSLIELTGIAVPRTSSFEANQNTGPRHGVVDRPCRSRIVWYVSTSTDPAAVSHGLSRRQTLSSSSQMLSGRSWRKNQTTESSVRPNQNRGTARCTQSLIATSRFCSSRR
jgi:hypothetical protein